MSEIESVSFNIVTIIMVNIVIIVTIIYGQYWVINNSITVQSLYNNIKHCIPGHIVVSNYIPGHMIARYTIKVTLHSG